MELAGTLDQESRYRQKNNRPHDIYSVPVSLSVHGTATGSVLSTHTLQPCQEGVGTLLSNLLASLGHLDSARCRHEMDASSMAANAQRLNKPLINSAVRSTDSLGKNGRAGRMTTTRHDSLRRWSIGYPCLPLVICSSNPARPFLAVEIRAQLSRTGCSRPSCGGALCHACLASSWKREPHEDGSCHHHDEPSSTRH